MKKIPFGLASIVLLFAGCSQRRVPDDGVVHFTLNGQNYQAQHMQLSIGSDQATKVDATEENVLKVPRGAPSNYSFFLEQTKLMRGETAKSIELNIKPAGYYPQLTMHWYVATTDPIRYLQTTKVDTTRTPGLNAITMILETAEYGILIYGAGQPELPTRITKSGGFWFEFDSVDAHRARGRFGGTITKFVMPPPVVLAFSGTFDVPVVQLYSY